MLLGKTIVITGIASGIEARIGELAIAMGDDVIGCHSARQVDPAAIIGIKYLRRRPASGPLADSHADELDPVIFGLKLPIWPPCLDRQIACLEGKPYIIFGQRPQRLLR
jgi:NAD(P)-dependent dehydrogenase (short-subunit alcohol dehydrogenase family)